MNGAAPFGVIKPTVEETRLVSGQKERENKEEVVVDTYKCYRAGVGALNSSWSVAYVGSWTAI